MQQAQHQSQQSKISFIDETNNRVIINVFTRTKLSVKRARRIVKLKYNAIVPEESLIVI